MDSECAPIYSSREDDPKLYDEICDFVVGLAEEVDLLQDAEADGELERLAELCLDLEQRARTYGYETLADVALQVSQASQEQKPESAQEALVELTDIGKRIRRGHRGAS
jgi:hypothetical protein